MPERVKATEPLAREPRDDQHEQDVHPCEIRVKLGTRELADIAVVDGIRVYLGGCPHRRFVVLNGDVAHGLNTEEVEGAPPRLNTSKKRNHGDPRLRSRREFAR